MIDWAEANTRSTIWSCLAAHAAVLHLDGIERQRLDAKCSGIFDCAKVGERLADEERLARRSRYAHSRFNALRKSDLTARGYQRADRIHRGRRRYLRQAAAQPFHLLSGPSGIRCACRCSGNICATSPGSSAGQRDGYPAFPPAISTPKPNTGSTNFQKRASAERKLPLSVEFPGLTLRPDIAAGAAAIGDLSATGSDIFPPADSVTPLTRTARQP